MRPLLHFSEDPDIAVFRPHVPASSPDNPPLVWTVDEDHAPGFWFPRQCPRACCWSTGMPPTEIGRALLGTGTRMHAIESGWLERMRACKLFVYRFDPAPFTIRKTPQAGYFATEETVTPLSVAPVGDLLARHAEAGIELRIVPNLWPVIDAVIALRPRLLDHPEGERVAARQLITSVATPRPSDDALIEVSVSIGPDFGRRA